MKLALASLLLVTGMTTAPAMLAPQDKLDPGLSNCKPVIHPTQPHLIIMNESADSSSLSFEMLLLGENDDKTKGTSANDGKSEKQIVAGKTHRVVIQYPSATTPVAKLYKLKIDGSPEPTPLLEHFGSLKSSLTTDRKLTLIDRDDIGGAMILVNHNGWMTQVVLKDFVVPETP